MTRTGRRTFTPLIAAIVTGVIATACASATPTAGGRTVTVGKDDAGTTVAVRVGDHVVVDLGSSTAIKFQWRLLDYPTPALRETASDAAAGRFEFQATAPGAGLVVLTGQAGCDTGAQSGGYGYGPRCPVAGAGGIPVLRFSVTIHVS